MSVPFDRAFTAPRLARDSGAAGGITPASLPPTVCSRTDLPDLPARPPGDLVAFEEITPRGDAAFPPSARAWRIQFVSTGKDNGQRTLACGIVVAPADPDAIAVADGRGRMAAWAHGTLGLVPRCQPANNPELEIWGPPPYGLGAVAWGSEAAGTSHAGTPEDGILAGMIRRGWVVSATDYAAPYAAGLTLQPYAIGKIEAANVIDCVRAAHRLVSAAYPGHAAPRQDVVVWGHSQGGHAALWTGQVFERYVRETHAPGDAVFRLRGVAAEAAASTLVTIPAAQGEDALGSGLLDWDTHSQLPVTGIPAPIQLGPFTMSYLAAAWTSASRTGRPDPSRMPAFPDTGELDLADLVTPAGADAVAAMSGICWADGAPVIEATGRFASEPFLVQAFGDGPVIDGQRRGNFDHACNGDVAGGQAAWCAWIAAQMPGPLGVHPLDKLPRQDGALVPLLLATGTNDGVVRCVAPDPDADAIPDARNCVDTALYEVLRGEYCPEGGPAGSLTYLVWRRQDGVTAADHSDITGLVAAAGIDDPSFDGSPLERFLSSAFEGDVQPGCRARVVNGNVLA